MARARSVLRLKIRGFLADRTVLTLNFSVEGIKAPITGSRQFCFRAALLGQLNASRLGSAYGVLGFPAPSLDKKQLAEGASETHPNRPR